MLVRRTIGVGRDVKALDGVSTQILIGRMTQPLFLVGLRCTGTAKSEGVGLGTLCDGPEWI